MIRPIFKYNQTFFFGLENIFFINEFRNQNLKIDKDVAFKFNVIRGQKLERIHFKLNAFNSFACSLQFFFWWGGGGWGGGRWLENIIYLLIIIINFEIKILKCTRCWGFS